MLIFFGPNQHIWQRDTFQEHFVSKYLKAYYQPAIMLGAR